ncbi:hypothetical protein [Bryobacter aggregatus]|uniref:hypothetical protein n=1 Tax=Bryobacter aggregatus TaxID=360054 RepID=UPI0012BA91C6|nr:hypothetical protein [Bryobacter aggregatus]
MKAAVHLFLVVAFSTCLRPSLSILGATEKNEPPYQLRFLSGAFPPETTDGEDRWLQRQGVLEIQNSCPEGHALSGALYFAANEVLLTPNQHRIQMELTGPNSLSRLEITHTESVEMPLTLQANATRFQFQVQGIPPDLPGDRRKLYLYFGGAKFTCAD